MRANLESESIIEVIGLKDSGCLAGLKRAVGLCMFVVDDRSEV
jgi:hypothetical protein